MALTSPGVQVTVIDESFYTPAEPGTTPLIVVATAQDKTNGAGTGTASATNKANAGKAFKLTSQRDLTELFGVPFFEKTASSTPIHGSERNEYGLLAAYSLLGVSNAAFIVRADVDLDQLEGQTSAPGANPDAGSWWVDTTGTLWGVQEWNGTTAATTGQKFTTKIPTVYTDSDSLKLESGSYGNQPKASVGVEGDYAVVFETGTSAKEFARLYYKRPTALGGGWVLVGSQDWTESWPAVYSGATITASVGDLSTKQWYINGTMVTGTGATVSAFLTDLVSDINTKLSTGQGISARVVNSRLYIYTEGRNDGDSTSSDAVYLENGVGGSAGDWADLEITVDSGSGTATYYGPRLQMSPHTQVPRWKATDTSPRPSGSVWVKTTSPNSGADWIIKQWNAGSASWVAKAAPLYATTHAAAYALDRSGGGLNIAVDSLFVQYSANETDGEIDEEPSTAQFRVWRRSVQGATSVTSAERTTALPSGIFTFTIQESVAGSASLNSVNVTTASLTGTTGAILTDFEKVAKAINDATYNEITGEGLKHVVASYSEADATFTLRHAAGGEIRIVDSTGTGIIGTIFGNTRDVYAGTGTVNFYAAPTGAADDYDYVISNWEPLAAQDFDAKADAPENEPTDGQLWYNPAFAEVDIMVHNGNTWVGFLNYDHGATGGAGGNSLPIVAASNPYESGTTETGDLWISTADLENYPTIYRYNGNLSDLPASERWVLIDKTDQTTEEGVLFADARYNTSGANSDTAGSLADLAESNYLDTDAPDPALYPRGMLLWNLRRSGGNVKRYSNNYIDTTERNARYDNTNSPNGDTFVTGEAQSSYFTDRWVTASPNNEDGSGSFGRKAQRGVVVAALKSAVDTSSEIRDEERRNFNLISCPGYPELMSNLVNLNIDRGITAFVIGDTPLRLPSDATSLTTWGTNANLVTDNGDDGIVTYDEYMACYYPNGFTTDLSGTGAVVPSSHMMLKTIALSDNVSYPWFAPAGTRRGGITNATAVGYIDSLSGEFQTVALNEGQRDTLYDLKINPIPFFNGVGLVAYGQKTRARNASALDRINVARLVVYLRAQLNKLARPYIFEPNDKITRDEIKQACESLLLELVGLRALYDFAVVCDESNNTPARVDRNELYVDIAIEPVKAVEFIYIPLRVKNTGEI